MKVFKGNGVDVGARARDGEALKGGKGVIAGGGSDERLGRRAFALNQAESTNLFSFVGHGATSAANETKVSIDSENLGDVLQNAEDQISEGLGQENGVLEVGHREIVFAGLDGSNVEFLKEQRWHSTDAAFLVQ